MKFSLSPHALYRFYDAQDTLLYVGISWSLAQRMAEHRHTKSWWQEIATIRIEWLPNREAVLEAETVAIVRERPKYNLANKTSPTTNERKIPTTIAELRSEGDRLFTAKELAAITGLSVNSIQKLVQDGRGPRRIQLGQYTRYLTCDILTWFDSKYSI